MSLPLTAFAEVELCLFRDALCDVHSGMQTGHTHVGRVGLYESTTLTALTMGVCVWGGGQTQ